MKAIQPKIAQRLHFLDKSITTRELIFILLLIFCLSPWISPPVALLLGVIVAQFIGHPYLHLNHKATHFLLQYSVVGLGFGMNAGAAWRAGRKGFVFTVASMAATLTLGLLLGKVFTINRKTSYLISAGTAICGGSAIAAISPVIRAEEKQISVALGTIFVLNSLALVLFPLIGAGLHLSQTQFGLWCAIAIHDTSSVVGAAAKFGNQALEIATTVKLARALWIIPVAGISAVVFNHRAAKIRIPYFIGLFVLAILLNTYLPFVQKFSPYVVRISKSGLTVTLFLIGCGLSKKTLASVGIKPILQGVILWGCIATASLFSILYFTH
ncbi:MAG TPA: putative sulfate exporter family transporter [Puia sp.]|nr:putative sulfate exporter family transporter [Puia sp.]